MAGLTGHDVEHMGALLSKTLSRSDLETFVYSSTGEELYSEYVAEGLPLRKTIEELLVKLEKLGATELFLTKVYIERPLRKDVREAIEQLSPHVVAVAAQPAVTYNWQKAGLVQGEVPGSAQAPGLQRVVRPHLAMQDIGVWLEKGNDIRHRVCRIEVAGRAAGTGFLVGSRAVLTNWHVVQNAVSAGKTAEVICIFDHVVAADGTRYAGTRVSLASGGCVDHSSYSPAELGSTPELPEPTADELDYALLELSEAIGDQPIDGGRPRGWIPLPAVATPVEPHAPLLIAQHPDGAPMKLAIDTDAVIGRVANGRRLRYNTNTLGGSSGSPVLDMDWTLVALHHFGDPAWRKPLFNQGIPAELIRNRISARGHADFLGV